MEGKLVSILVLCAQLAAASVLAVPTVTLQPAAVPHTTHVAVGGNNGTSIFDPSRLSLLPGDEIIFDCYEDNMWLLKATIDFSHVDGMPSVLLCQRNVTLTMQVSDQEPHIYYSPAVLGRSSTNMTLFLNQPDQSQSQSPSYGMLSSTALMPPYPSQGSSKASLLNTGTMPLSTGRLTSTTPQPTYSITTSRFPVAPTHAPTVLSTSTPSTSDAQTWAGSRGWIAVVPIIVMFAI